MTVGYITKKMKLDLSLEVSLFSYCMTSTQLVYLFLTYFRKSFIYVTYEHTSTHR